MSVSLLLGLLSSFGLETNWLICSSSEPDLIIIPLFFVPKPVLAFIGFISIAIDGGLFLNVGNFNRNAPVQ